MKVMNFTRLVLKQRFEIKFENQIRLGLTGADLTGYVAHCFQIRWSGEDEEEAHRREEFPGEGRHWKSTAREFPGAWRSFEGWMRWGHLRRSCVLGRRHRGLPGLTANCGWSLPGGLNFGRRSWFLSAVSPCGGMVRPTMLVGAPE
jgi:hypothetical protein